MTTQRLNDLMRAAVVVAIFLFMAWVYHFNKHDEIIIGAIIASFTTAVGYYLGHAAGKAESQHQLGQALDMAVQSQRDRPTGQPDDPVHVEEERP